MGELVASLAAKPDKIHQLLESFLKYDPFLARLVQLSKAYNEFAQSSDPEMVKKAQTIQMNILRSDYMLDWPSGTAKLVEYNCIASSFGILSQKVKQVQKYIREKYGAGGENENFL